MKWAECSCKSAIIAQRKSSLVANSKHLLGAASLTAPASCKMNVCQVKKNICREYHFCSFHMQASGMKAAYLWRRGEDLQYISLQLNWQRASAKGSPHYRVLCASEHISSVRRTGSHSSASCTQMWHIPNAHEVLL